MSKTSKKQANQELISVIVACYNQGEYLNESLQSILCQSYKNIEIIIINDGSTDNSSQVASEIIRDNPQSNIVYIEQDNTGVATARNNAIAQSKGSFILPLDADDKIHPSFLTETHSLLKRMPRISIAYTDYQYFGDADHVVITENYDLSSFLYKKNLFTSTALFKKKAWLEAGGYNKNMIWGFEDWEFWISCGAKGHFGARVPKILFFYRAKLAESTRNKSANHNSARLFARMTLNHPQFFDQQRIKWAKGLWNDALSDILDNSDPRGCQYLKSLSAVELVTECELLSESKSLLMEAKLYQFWILNSVSNLKFVAFFNLGICLEKQGRTIEAISAYKHCLSLNSNFDMANARLKFLGVIIS